MRCMYQELFELCWEARKFLEPRWFSLHQLWGDSQPETLSKFMCRYTSIFLKAVLSPNSQPSWRLVAGRPILKEYEGTAKGYFGFCTSTGLFFDHCWIQLGGLIVDITADQFGAEAVIITSVGDPRYFPNLEEADLCREIAKLTHRPAKWLQEWDDQHRKDAAITLKL
jgi:hypothetical protein